MSDTKICPFCAEEIKAAAVKCRYCQSDLSGTRQPARALFQGKERQEHQEHQERQETEADAETRPSGEARPAGVPRRWAVLLLAAIVLAAAAVGYLFWELTRLQDSSQARTTGQVTATEYVEKILSYNHERYDQDVERARALMSGGFADEYTETVDLVREEVVANEAVVEAEVVASSVVSASPDEVQTLLFVNQTTTGKQVEKPRVDLNRVRVTLTRDGDGWLVSGLDAL